MASVTIVGASTAGLSLAKWLRQLGFSDPIKLIGDEPHYPYNRTALTKESALTSSTIEPFEVADAVELQNLEITFLGNTRATALNPAAGVVKLRTGESQVQSHRYESLAIATGLRARKLNPAVSGALSLRTIDDLFALQQATQKAQSAIVLGSGVLAAELTGLLATQGIAVKMITRPVGPLRQSFGPRVAASMLAALGEVGASIVTGEVVDAIETLDGFQVNLQDGQSFEADLLITAIGATPNSDWLAGSGLQLSGGLVQAVRGLAAPNIWALGDVARWTDYEKDPKQLQSRAVDHARTVAHRIMGLQPPSLSPSYSWTHVAGVKTQAVGEPAAANATVSLAESGERFLELHTRNGQPVALTSFGMPREFTKARILYEPEINNRRRK